MNGINLAEAYAAAVKLAGLRGLLSLALFERRPCLVWKPVAAPAAVN